MVEEPHHPLSDPLGYYSILGVGPLADSHEIKKAYQSLQNKLDGGIYSSDHQDYFLKLTEAYRHLSTSQLRQDYDSTALCPTPTSLVDRDDPSPSPLHCMRCGCETVYPLFLILKKIKSTFFRSYEMQIQGLFCSHCADKTAIQASTFTWFLGWWNFRGMAQSFKAIINNLRGGYKPKGDNFLILLHQARAYLYQNKPELADQLLDISRRYSDSDAQENEIKKIANRLIDRNHIPLSRLEKARFKSQWTIFRYGTLVQALPLCALFLAVIGIVIVITFRQTIPFAHSEIQYETVKPGEIRYSAVDLLKIRQNPTDTSPTLALLDRFTTVEIEETSAGWARITAPSGISGYVKSRYLYAGSPLKSYLNWCIDEKGEPPKNGEILLRRQTGDRHLFIQNITNQDSLVRLKSLSGKTLMSFFVASDNNIRIDNVPDEPLQFVFATGLYYSHACHIFLNSMKSYRLNQKEEEIISFSKQNYITMTIQTFDDLNKLQPIENKYFIDYNKL